MQRPASLKALLKTVEDLGTYGEVKAQALPVQWLTGIGVAIGSGEWLVATDEWARTGLNARNERDLLRKLAFRDPTYRFYLDSLLAEVLQGMARAGYLNKAEELLTGRLCDFGPRLVNVLRQVQEEIRTEVNNLEQRHWAEYRSGFFGTDLLDIFDKWDKDLIGNIPGGPEHKFDVLVEHYGPLLTMPVYVHSSLWDLTRRDTWLLKQIIEAGKEDEGVYLPPGFADSWQRLNKIGLPVRLLVSGAGEDRVVCVGPVFLYSTDPGISYEVFNRCSASDLLNLARAFCGGKCEVEPPAVRSLKEGLWAAGAGKQRIGAFPGTDGLLAGVIPKYSIALEETGSLTSKDFSDDMLVSLAKHPLYGIIIQFFLTKSFEAAMGDDCIVVTGGRVYYTPGVQFNETERFALDVGGFDDIMTRIGERLGVYTVPPVYQVSQGPWTLGIQRLKSIGGIFTRSKEVILDQDFFLNRCHSWVPMFKVVQHGKEVREIIHKVLHDLWRDHKERSLVKK